MSMRTPLLRRTERGADRPDASRIAGWAHRRRDHGGVIFIDLRDREGLAQVVCDPDRADAFKLAEGVRNEFVLRVTGVVRARPAGTVNPNLRSGEIEVLAHEVEVLNPSLTPPFQLDDDNLSETVRLEHRILDLRRDADAEEPAPAARGLARGARLSRRPRLRRHRDPGALQVDARGRARVPRALAHQRRPVLRAAAEPAAVQADADDRRLRPLLPDRQVLPRRGPARRPAAGVHADRHRDLVHGRRCDPQADGRARAPPVQGSAGRRAARPVSR